MSITALPPAPQRGDTAFAATADAFLAALPTFATEAEAMRVEVLASEATSAASAAAAAAAAHYVGAWSALSGALAIPASASHDGRVWVLVANVADVTAHEPGVSAQWVPSYPQRRLPILSADTLSLSPWGGNEVLHNSLASLPLTPTHICSNGTTLVANAASGSQVAQSADGGLTWILRSLPASGTWAVAPLGTAYIATMQGSSGATATAYSTDGGVTWTGYDVSGATWSGSSVQERLAGGAWSTRAAVDSGSLIYVATAGTTWSAGQTRPGTTTRLWVLADSSVVARTSGTTYYTSPTGLTGTWTTRSLPGTCDTVVQDTDGALLAYKAGSLIETVRRTTDGATWTDTGIRLPHTTAVPYSINGIYLCGPASGAATGYTRHNGLWVPRTMLCAPTADPRQLAKAGALHVGITGGLAYHFDATTASAAQSTWE